MDRSGLSAIAHTHHPLAAPVSAERAAALLTRLPLPPGARVLDLGCGQGEWLLTLLAARPDVTAVGVDLAAVALARASERAAARGLADRVVWQQADAGAWTGVGSGDGAGAWADAGGYDAALCIGATHAFGGLPETLRALHRHIRPGGHAVLGDGFWETRPTDAAQSALQAGPDDLPDLPGLVDAVLAGGWAPIAGHTSTAEEWDDYEWAWTGSLTEWSLREAPDDATAEQARAAAEQHRSEWLRGYRHQLGFVTLVLADAVRR